MGENVSYQTSAEVATYNLAYNCKDMKEDIKCSGESNYEEIQISVNTDLANVQK